MARRRRTPAPAAQEDTGPPPEWLAQQSRRFALGLDRDPVAPIDQAGAEAKAVRFWRQLENRKTPTPERKSP